MRIIPAIDIIEGKCVRLTKGDYATKKIYNESPLEIAKQFEASGIQYLHVVDLDGAKAKHIVNYKVLEEIALKTSLKIDFGGGLKSNEDLKIAFNSGANQIIGGSVAVKNTSLFEAWITKYGADKIILGADFYPDTTGGKIATNGWQEESSLQLIPFIEEYLKKGIESVICTDISKDGMLQGPSFDTYNKIINLDTVKTERAGVLCSIKLIASGGVSSFSELTKLQELGCDGVIIGKAIYENKISLKQLETFVLNN